MPYFSIYSKNNTTKYCLVITCQKNYTHDLSDRDAKRSSSFYIPMRHKMTSSSTACLVCGNFICSPFKKYCELMEYLFLVILITLFLGGWSLKKVLEVWFFSIDTIYKQTRRIANVKSTWRKKKFLTRQFLFVLLGIWSEELLMSLLL